MISYRCACMDPKQFNAVIKKTYHRAPTFDEISHKLNVAKVFSKLDGKLGYWRIKLDEDSSEHCEFNSPPKESASSSGCPLVCQSPRTYSKSTWMTSYEVRYMAS